MNDSLFGIFDDVFISDFSVNEDGNKTVIELGENGEYGNLEAYSLFPGVILAYIDVNIDNVGDVFFEQKINHRLLEINHCDEGRYSYAVNDDKVVYFGKGDLCISVYDLTKSFSDFPVGYYKGLELFIDVDVANDYIGEYIPDFDLIEFYEDLKSFGGYVLIRANEKIDHVIGELYSVDERIKESYFKLKCLELLLFFSITDFKRFDCYPLSRRQVDIVDRVKDDLICDLSVQITIDELACKYGISKTGLKNSFKEVYGKPIFKWRKEFKLNYACKLIEDSDLSIGEISRRVGYSSPSKFSQAFKDYVGCSPSEYRG
ncbi:MAG: helix-turn-helix transcriptional regulator [Methanobrevibacter thaueri]|nr:helix-turn-helix transcriptional regulator [Methanobrevibacter thaueri]